MLQTGIIRRHLRSGIATAGLLVPLCAGWAADAAAPAPGKADTVPKPLFGGVGTLDIVLTMPWETIEKDEFFDQGVFPARLDLSATPQGAVSFDLGMQRRGASRQSSCTRARPVSCHCSST